MRAVLLVPDTERIGLTGKPLINKQGIVGSLKGSFSAGQRVTLINLRGISQKIAEAQQAISGADDNIRRSGETIDDIKKKNNDLATRLNDYWTRWDNKGVQDEYADLQFIGTAMSMDKVRTAMLGESVDPYPFYEDLIIPRGMYWDPVFKWRKHSLNIEKGDNLIAYSTRGGSVYLGKSVSSLVSSILINYGTLMAAQAACTATMTMFMSSLGALGGVIVNMWNGAPLTKGVGAGFIAYAESFVGISSGNVFANIAKELIVTAVSVSVAAIFAILLNNIKSYEHVELMGYNASTYDGSTAQENTLHESWYTYAYVDAIVEKALSIPLSKARSYYLKNTYLYVKEIMKVNQLAGQLASIGAMPDIPGEHPRPNIAAINAAFSAFYDWFTPYSASFTKFATTQTMSTLYHVSSIFSLAAFFMFTTTRTNTNPVAPINDFNPLQYGPSSNPKPYGSYNKTGTMETIPLDGWVSNVGKIMSIGGGISSAIGEISSALTGAMGITRSETASEACSGGPTRYDSYVASIPIKPYIDWWNKRVNVQGWTANINNIAGVGQNTQTFYGKLSPRTGIVNYYSMYVRTKSPIYFGDSTKIVEGSVTFNGITYDNIKIKVPSGTSSYLDIPFDPNDKTTPIKNDYAYWTLNITKNNTSSSGSEIEGHTNPGVISATASKGKLVCWSHVFNKNILNIKPKQIGNRTIEKTIVIKTRYEFGTGIYRACQVLCKCVGSDTLYLLLERDMQRFYNGNNADVMMIEQVIYNFDPENYGDFFTGHRGGKISEVFAYTFDGHIISYRPNMEWKDNYLLGDFVNREVTHFEKFYYKSIAPSNSSEGHIDSYENVYR